MEHRSRELRQDVVVLRARDALVSVRTELINTTRGWVKSMRLPKCSSPSFLKKVEEMLPAEVREALLPLVGLAAALSDCIKDYDERIEKLGREKYEHTELLRQVKGVGPLTSLAYVLTLENPDRFAKEPGRRGVRGISAPAGGFRGQPAAIANQQGGRWDAAAAPGRERPVYLGAVRTGHRLTAVWATAVRERREECEEACGGSGGAEIGGIVASAVDQRRSV